MGKSPFKSKTLWVNLIALIAIFAQNNFGTTIAADDQLAVLAFVNLVLRLITKEPLDWSKSGGCSSGFARLRLMVLLQMACAVALILALIGCTGTPLQRAGKSALVARATVVSLADAADTACTQGVLTQPQCDLASDAYRQAHAAYLVAVGLLQTALDAETEAAQQTAWQRYLVARTDFNARLAELTGLLDAFGIDTEN